jgi:hypothetical protein
MYQRILAGALLAAATSAFGADLNLNHVTTQKQFRQLSEDLGAALSYKPLIPAEPGGITGFDVGVEATVTGVANGTAMENAFGEKVSSLPVAKVHAHKGLPFGIDLGGFYGNVPGTNVTVSGAELRYAIVEGNAALPAVGVRGSWTRMGGVDQMDLSTKGLDLTVSKGLAIFTPYAGVGQVWVDSDADSATGLDKESFTESKVYLGLNVNMGLTNLAFEADRTGDDSTVGAKIGFRW